MISGILGKSKPSSRTPSPPNTKGQQQSLKNSSSSDSLQAADEASQMSDDEGFVIVDNNDHSNAIKAESNAKAAADAKAAKKTKAESLIGVFSTEASHEDDTCGFELLPIEKKETDKKQNSNNK